MAAHKLTADAEDDLQRIYNYGFEQWGEAAADGYYGALFDRFEEIAERPHSYPAVDDVRKGYRRSDGIVEIMAILGHQDTDQNL